jgi:hypothetical protein
MSSEGIGPTQFSYFSGLFMLFSISKKAHLLICFYLSPTLGPTHIFCLVRPRGRRVLCGEITSETAAPPV